MTEEAATALRYRAHAEELRVIADQDRDGKTRDTLKRIAEDYDSMAATMDAIDRTNAAIRRASPRT